MAKAEIKIVGFDPEATQPSGYGPDTALRQLFLELNEYPEQGWIDFFSNIHEHTFNMRKRHAYVVGNYLVVDCLPEELQGQIDMLKPQVAEANKQYANWLNDQAAKHAQQEAEDQAESKSLNDLKNKLKF